MTAEHEVIAAFRAYVNDGVLTPPSVDNAFIRAVGDFDRVKYDSLNRFVFGNAAGCRGVSAARNALADYDRLVADRATPTEHPDITTYRMAAEGTPTAEQDAAFVRAILADERVRNAAVNDSEWGSELSVVLAHFFEHGHILDEDAAVIAYDATINPAPVQTERTEQDDNGQQLIACFQEALDALIECATKLESAIGNMRRVV